MGRKHKNSSFKYVMKCLKQENECLKQMVNYVTVRNIETQNKLTMLENYSNELIKILNVQREANDF
jgi:hypothetical protein